MSGDRPLEVHYINTGFPYTVTDSLMNLFEGLSYPQANEEALQNQENAYWSVHASTYKYELSNPLMNDHNLIKDENSKAWESHLVIDNENALSLDHVNAVTSTSSPTSAEECIRGYHHASNTQGLHVNWQDNIDPDSMAYEELLDLGEAVGTQNRGLPKQLISLLPITRYKRSFFSRKKKDCDRCVICQMDFKGGDWQMTLPCKHTYHTKCITKWLGINKACPVCFVQVFAEESSS